MKISTRGRYGVRILLDLALHQDGAPRLIRDIAESQRISEKYIARLVIALRRAGMVRSQRGAKGGFRLAGKPEDLTLLDIVEVMEGPVGIVDCVTAPAVCTQSAGCATREIWERLNADIRDSMRKVTLRDIIEHHRRRQPDEACDYCI